MNTYFFDDLMAQLLIFHAHFYWSVTSISKNIGALLHVISSQHSKVKSMSLLAGLIKILAKNKIHFVIT
jgi:hypothetical protein